MICPRKIIWAGHVAHSRKITNTWNMLVRKSEEKRPLGIIGAEGTGINNE
jgi:hypothetical protein